MVTHPKIIEVADHQVAGAGAVSSIKTALDQQLMERFGQRASKRMRGASTLP